MREPIEEDSREMPQPRAQRAYELVSSLRDETFHIRAQNLSPAVSCTGERKPSNTYQHLHTSLPNFPPRDGSLNQIIISYINKREKDGTSQFENLPWLFRCSLVCTCMENNSKAEIYCATKQKAAKQLAARNSATLKRMHTISLLINACFLFLRFLLFWASTNHTHYLVYFLLASPALLIEFWLERIGRPIHAANGEVKKSGEDLDARGMTEFLWDVLYWSWGCTLLAGLFGNMAWWLWSVIPLYSIWVAYTTFGGMRQSMSELAGQGVLGDASSDVNLSNRQKKMEKRGGQKIQYR